jgi:hypothetical protein
MVTSTSYIAFLVADLGLGHPTAPGVGERGLLGLCAGRAGDRLVGIGYPGRDGDAAAHAGGHRAGDGGGHDPTGSAPHDALLP